MVRPSIYPQTKRLMDLTASVTLTILLIPLFVTISAIIALTLRCSPILVQERIGKDGIPFNLYKFRTMRKLSNFQPQRKSEELLKIEGDPRVTSVGKILRRTCLDELPQLFNVLKGEMSLVGPRPNLPIEVKNLDEWQKQRFKVLPGITGPWQVGGMQ